MPIIDILIATDANYLSSLINNILCQQGYSICGIAKSKKELFELCDLLSPEIVILDLSLDNTKTFNKSSNIIKDLLSFDENLLIIAIGDDVSNEFRDTLLECGVKEYLCKPFQPASLWERIGRIIKIYIIELNENNKTFSRETIKSNSDYLNLPHFNQTFKNTDFHEDLEQYSNSNNQNFDESNSYISTYEDENEKTKHFVNFIKSLFDKLK
ncbi:MAG: response regulator [Romboutsia sp.]|nr:response regulator [Romboutsia sp.]